jgi:hypothetical protein
MLVPIKILIYNRASDDLKDFWQYRNEVRSIRKHGQYHTTVLVYPDGFVRRDFLTCSAYLDVGYKKIPCKGIGFKITEQHILRWWLGWKRSNARTN